MPTQDSATVPIHKDRSGQERLAALFRVSQVLGVSLNLDEVLNQVMDAVINLTGAERGFLVLLEPNEENRPLRTPLTDGLHPPESMYVRAARNFNQETLEPKDVEVSRSVLRSVLETGKGVVTTDARSDPRFALQKSVLLYALRSILCAPLKARGNTIGMIYVDNRAHAGLFTGDDLSLLTAFATQAAIAIENARLYTRTDHALAERVAELETLTRIDRDLNAHLDYARVLEISRRWALQGTGATQCWTAMYGAQEKGSGLSLREPRDGNPDNLPGWELAFEYIASTPACGDLPDEAKPAVVEAIHALTPHTLFPKYGRPAYLAAPFLHSGKPIGVLVVARPVSSRTRQPSLETFPESALHFMGRLAGRASNAIENARLYQAVQDTNQEKSKFVSLVTHELRIPMTSIKGYTDLLRQQTVGSVNDQQLHFLDIIRNNVDRMSSLVSELSDISRIESGRMKLELGYIDLPAYVDEALQNLSPKLEEKNQTLRTSIAADLPRIYADPIRVVQILTNLLSNAWKYTPAGGEIGVRVFTQNATIKVEIQDNGIGISPEDQAMLFTQFFRSEDPGVREQPGWGLGLNITRRLVELMGGEIGVQSKVKEGSTFWFTLPVKDERLSTRA